MPVLEYVFGALLNRRSHFAPGGYPRGWLERIDLRSRIQAFTDRRAIVRNLGQRADELKVEFFTLE